MYQIVIPVDEGETQAVEAARFVANLTDESGLNANIDDISITVVSVFEEFSAVDEGGNVSSEDLYDEDDFPESVLTVRDQLTNADFRVDLVRRHGKPGEEVIEYAASIDADSIVLHGRSRSPVGKALFGSVTQDIILDAEQPVTIV